MKKYGVYICMLFVSSCAFLGGDAPQTRILMPEEEAKEVLLEHFPNEWVDSPFFNAPYFCGENGVVRIDYRDIDYATTPLLAGDEGGLVLGVFLSWNIYNMCAHGQIILPGPLTETERQSIIDALNSLGADL